LREFEIPQCSFGDWPAGGGEQRLREDDLMNTLRDLLGTAVLAMAMGFSSQAPADILLKATDGVKTVMVDDHATPGVATYSGIIDNFTLSVDVGTGFPAVGAPYYPILDLTSLDLTTGTTGGTLTISLTETDFDTDAAFVDFASSIVGNYLNSSAMMSTYLDTTNAHFGTNTPLSSGLLNNQSGVASAATGAGPFSLTEIVTVAAGANSLASVDAAIMVPEPTPLYLLGAALFGLAMIGLASTDSRLPGALAGSPPRHPLIRRA
jgi:hypothetical protein